MSKQQSHLFGSALKSKAKAEATTAARAVWRMRARELNGVNARTRPILEAESREAYRATARSIYLANGYTECQTAVAVWHPEENVYMPEPCENLVSPGFHECPTCAERSRQEAEWRMAEDAAEFKMHNAS